MVDEAQAGLDAETRLLLSTALRAVKGNLIDMAVGSLFVCGPRSTVGLRGGRTHR